MARYKDEEVVAALQPHLEDGERLVNFAYGVRQPNIWVIFLLMLPAIVVSVVFFVIWFGIEDVPGTSSGGLDLGGLAILTAALGLVIGFARREPAAARALAQRRRARSAGLSARG